MEIVLPHLEQWQKDVYLAINSRKRRDQFYIVKARRQVGKSVLAEVELISFSLKKPGTCSAIVEPTLNQSRRVYKQIVSMLQGSGVIKSANASLLTIEFVNGSEILFKSAEQQDALRGMTISGILVIDEAAYIEDEVFEILYPCVNVHNAPVLVISTPLFCDGKFYELFNSPIYRSFDWSKYDTSKYLSSEKLEQYRKEMSPNKFRSEYLGEFIVDGSFVFSNLKACIKETDGTPVFCGIDWAVGNQGDFTVITFLTREGNVTKIESFNNLEPSEQIKVIANLINSNPQLECVQVEQNSIGAVYADYLKKAMNKPQILTLFNTNNESKRRVIEQLVSAFQTEKITIPDNKELLRQLNHYSVEKTKTGYTYNGIGAHDDMVISLALGYDLCAEKSKGNYVLSFGGRKRYR